MVCFYRTLCVGIVLATGFPLAQPVSGVLGLPELEPDAGGAPVTVTWYGVTTLLFDDGDTKLLIDGFFSRPTAYDDPTAPDLPQIRRLIATAGLESLAVVTRVTPTSTTQWTSASSRG